MNALDASKWLVSCSLLAASSLAMAAEPDNGLIFNGEPARVVDEGGLGRNFTSILWASIQDRGDQPQRNGPHWMTPRSQLDMPSDWVPGRPYRPSAAPAMTTTSFSSSSAKPAPALSGKGG